LDYQTVTDKISRIELAESSLHNLGVAKVLRIDARQHQPFPFVCVTEFAISSLAERPQGAVLRHGQLMCIATGYREQ